MILGRISRPFLPIQVLAIRPAGHGIVFPEEASTPQLRKQERDDVFEGVGEEGVCLGVS